MTLKSKRRRKTPLGRWHEEHRGKPGGMSHYDYMKKFHKRRREAGMQDRSGTVVVRGRRYKKGQQIYKYPSMARTHKRPRRLTAKERAQLHELKPKRAASRQRRQQRRQQPRSLSQQIIIPSMNVTLPRELVNLTLPRSIAGSRKKRSAIDRMFEEIF